MPKSSAKSAATKRAPAPQEPTEGATPASSGGERVVRLKPINVRRLQVRIVGTTPLIHHQWSEKAKSMIREKQQGRKSKDRDTRDPEREFNDATYRLPNGAYAIPSSQLKSAICAAAHRDIGIERTLVRKGLFIESDHGFLLELETSGPPKQREDIVRVGMGSADLRYRPEYVDWAVTLRIQFDADLLQVADILSLLERAGFGVGAGEWRPERDGEYGRFQIDRQSVRELDASA